jgi:hypothetical protein
VKVNIENRGGKASEEEYVKSLIENALLTKWWEEGKIISNSMGEIEVSTINLGWIWLNTKRIYNEQWDVESDLEIETRKVK